jgi:hypothetical protein
VTITKKVRYSPAPSMRALSALGEKPELSESELATLTRVFDGMGAVRWTRDQQPEWLVQTAQSGDVSRVGAIGGGGDIHRNRAFQRDADIEQATAAPGEKRNRRRPAPSRTGSFIPATTPPASLSRSRKCC